ncbi:MAG TPA: VWA domain-containing protein [Thermoanaerobaculia bacterium]|nr:VWA domain-containing protein [Thermoanaerobaculia bacterium]
MSALSPLLLALALGLPTQGGTPPPALSETVEVNLVNVDVHVTDRSGQAIRGLQAQDFEVRDNGRVVAVTHFEEIGDFSTGRDIAANRTVRAPQAAIPPPPLYLVVFVDSSSSRPGGRATLLRQLGEVVEQTVRPEDYLMLASFSRELVVHHPFTTDRAAFRRGLAEVEQLPALAHELDSELDLVRQAAAYVLDDDAATRPHLAEAAVQRYADVATLRTVRAFNAAGDLIRTLASVDGRKNMIYASDGMELTPGSFLIRQILDRQRQGVGGNIRAQNFSVALAVKNFTAVANAARVTLYPFDMGGARETINGTIYNDEYRRSLQDTLVLMAHETGGRALLNTIQVGKALETVRDDQQGYYSIAFESTRRGLGELHHLDVKVKRRGAQARFRQSYRDDAEEDAKRQRLLAALWLGERPNPLEVRLEPAGTPVPNDEGLYLVPVRIGVPLDRLVLQQTATGHDGEIEVFVTAVGADGTQAAMSRAYVPVAIPTERWEGAHGQLFGYELKLWMKPGVQRLAVGVQDVTGGEISVLVTEIQVGATAVAAKP